jgi:hypothetical protein
MPITIAKLPVQDVLFQLDAGLCVPVLAQVRFQLFQTGLRRPDVPVTGDSKPQEQAIPRPFTATFVEVDRQKPKPRCSNSFYIENPDGPFD